LIFIHVLRKRKQWPPLMPSFRGAMRCEPFRKEKLMAGRAVSSFLQKSHSPNNFFQNFCLNYAFIFPSNAHFL